MPDRSTFTPVGYFTISVDAQTTEILVLYSRPDNKIATYFELYDQNGRLILIRWVEKSGVTKTALDLGVLDKDGAEPGEYLGVPIPSSMVLILAGALAAQGHLDLSVVFVLALVAATLGDAFWFIIGRMRGEVFIKGYCKLSLGSRDCVQRTKELFLRHPRLSLLLGKFVPGLSTFVVPVAGFSGAGYMEFLRYDSGGIFLWALTMIAIGYGSGEWIRTYAESAGHSRWLLLAMMVTILGCFYGIKLWRLKKFGPAEITEAS